MDFLFSMADSSVIGLEVVVGVIGSSGSLVLSVFAVVVLTLLVRSIGALGEGNEVCCIVRCTGRSNGSTDAVLPLGSASTLAKSCSALGLALGLGFPMNGPVT